MNFNYLLLEVMLMMKLMIEADSSEHPQHPQDQNASGIHSLSSKCLNKLCHSNQTLFNSRLESLGLDSFSEQALVEPWCGFFDASQIHSMIAKLIQ